MSKFQLSHIPLRFKDDKELQGFLNLSQLQQYNKSDNLFLETKISSILLKDTQCEVYLFKVKKYQHKENKEIFVHHLEPYLKIDSKLDSQNLMQDFHFQSAIPDADLIDLVKVGGDQTHTASEFQSCEVPPTFLKHYNWKIPNIKYQINLKHQSVTNKLRQKQTSLQSIGDDVVYMQHHIIQMQLEVPSDADDKTKNSDIYQTILQLFEKRPIWIRNSLICSLNNHQDVNLQSFKKCLRHIAYLYKRGPWKHCYVKFGYDPKLDPKAAIYQTFEIGTGESNGARHYANPNTQYDPTLSLRPSNYRNKYQFCDINDKQLKLLVGKSIAQAEEYGLYDNILRKDLKCDAQFGWFNQSTLKELLKLAKFKLQQL